MTLRVFLIREQLVLKNKKIPTFNVYKPTVTVLNKIAPLLSGLLILAYIFNNTAPGWRGIENTYIYYAAISFVIICLLLVARKYTNRQKVVRLHLTLIDVSIYAFALYVVVRTDFSTTSMFDEKVLGGIYLFFIYQVFRLIFSNIESKTVMGAICVVAMLGVVHGLAQYIGLGPSTSEPFHVIGTFGNPGPYAGYLACLLPFLVGFFLENLNSRNIQKGIIIGLATGTLFLLIATESRAAWLASICSLLFLFSYHFNFVKRFSPYISTLLPGLFLTIILLIPFKKDSISGRILIWQVSLEMFKQKPLTGLGLGQFSFQYNDYQAAYFTHHPEQESTLGLLADNSYHAFNEPLEVLIEHGVIGFFFAALLIFGIFSSRYACCTWFLKSCKACMLAVLIFGLFSFPFSSNAISLLVIISLSYLSSNISNQNAFTFKLEKVTMYTIVATVFVCIFAFAIVRKQNSVIEWRKAHARLEEGDTTAFADYRKLLSEMESNGDFLFNYGAQLSKTGMHEKSLTILEKAKAKFSHIDLYIFQGNNYRSLGRYKEAEAAYLHAARTIPSRMYPRYMLVQTYLENNETKKALEVAKQILSMQVKVRSSMTTAIIKEMKTLVKRHDLNRTTRFQGRLNK